MNQEQGKIEWRVWPGDTLAGGQQDQFAGPPRLEGRELFDDGAVGRKVVQQHPVGRGARQQGVGAVLQSRDGRQGDLGQTAAISPLQPCLETHLLGGTQDVVGIERLAVRRELVPELSSIGRLREQAEQGDERQ
jgi:hypothetical protein